MSARRRERPPLAAPSALLLALLALVAPGAAAQGRLRWAEVELSGPLFEAVIDAGPAGRTHLSGELLAGETRRLVVPVPTSALVRAGSVRAEVVAVEGLDLERRARARLTGWREAPDALAALPPALRARPRPALALAAGRASPALLASLAAACALGLSLRRRPAAALALAVAAGGASFLLVRAPVSGPLAQVRVFEGSAGSTGWLEVESAFGRMHFEAGPGSCELETDPPQARLELRLRLGRPGELIALAPGARLDRLRPAAPHLGALTPLDNDFGPLERSWRRSAGAWSAHGAWVRGEALPPVLGVSPAPPGWLAGGLPQGSGVLLGRLRTEPADGVAWVRTLTGD